MISNNPLAVEPKTENDADRENSSVTFFGFHLDCSGGLRDNVKDFVK
jgi:hypothetical protein